MGLGAKLPSEKFLILNLVEIRISFLFRVNKEVGVLSPLPQGNIDRGSQTVVLTIFIVTSARSVTTFS